MDKAVSVSTGFMGGKIAFSCYKEEKEARYEAQFAKTLFMQWWQISSAIEVSKEVLSAAKIAPLPTYATPYVKGALTYIPALFTLLTQVEWGDTYKRRIVLGVHDLAGHLAVCAILASHIASIKFGHNTLSSSTTLASFAYAALIEGRCTTLDKTFTGVNASLQLLYGHWISKLFSLVCLYSLIPGTQEEQAAKETQNIPQWIDMSQKGINWSDYTLPITCLHNLPLGPLPQENQPQLARDQIKTHLVQSVTRAQTNIASMKQALNQMEILTSEMEEALSTFEMGELRKRRLSEHKTFFTDTKEQANREGSTLLRLNKLSEAVNSYFTQLYENAFAACSDKYTHPNHLVEQFNTACAYYENAPHIIEALESLAEKMKELLGASSEGQEIVLKQADSSIARFKAVCDYFDALSEAVRKTSLQGEREEEYQALMLSFINTYYNSKPLDMLNVMQSQLQSMEHYLTGKDQEDQKTEEPSFDTLKQRFETAKQNVFPKLDQERAEKLEQLAPCRTIIEKFETVKACYDEHQKETKQDFRELLQSNNRWRLRESSSEEGADMSFLKTQYVEPFLDSYVNKATPAPLRPYLEEVIRSLHLLPEHTLAKLVSLDSAWPLEKQALLFKAYYFIKSQSNDRAEKALASIKYTLIDRLQVGLKCDSMKLVEACRHFGVNIAPVMTPEDLENSIMLNIVPTLRTDFDQIGSEALFGNSLTRVKQDLANLGLFTPVIPMNALEDISFL